MEEIIKVSIPFHQALSAFAAQGPQANTTSKKQNTVTDGSEI